MCPIHNEGLSISPAYTTAGTDVSNTVDGTTRVTGSEVTGSEVRRGVVHIGDECVERNDLQKIR